MGVTSGEHAAVAVRVSRASLPPRARRLSECLWDIDYEAMFPMVVSDDGITVEVAGPEDVKAFAGENFGTIFGDPLNSPFWVEGGSRDARDRYLHNACDAFLFRDGEKPVGVFIGNPVDWSTYYVRSIAFLEAYQGRALFQPFVAQLFALLARAGVARVEVDTAPSNGPCLSAVLRLGFAPSGSFLSERWGALTRWTKYLSLEAEMVFLRQFCASGSIHQQKRLPRSDAVAPSKKGVIQ